MLAIEGNLNLLPLFCLVTPVHTIYAVASKSSWTLMHNAASKSSWNLMHNATQDISLSGVCNFHDFTLE
jgi:hypothetical protein